MLVAVESAHDSLTGRVTEVMDEVEETVAPLEKIVEEIAELTESGGKYNEAPHVIEVTLPLLCRSVLHPLDIYIYIYIYKMFLFKLVI